MLRTVQLATRATTLLQGSCSSPTLPLLRPLHTSRAAASDASDLAASRAAYEQRKLLDALRPAKAASSASSLASSGRPAGPNSLAGAALDAQARGGGMRGMPGLMGAGEGAGTGGGALDRAAGGGKSWGKLTGKEKVVRAGLNSGRLTIILIGGTLTLAVAWAVSTELLARNSPTVIYNDACKRIKDSPELYEHLLPPLRFSTSSSASPVNPRGLSAKHHVLLPSSNPEERDVMLLRFFIASREAGKDWTLWQTAREGVVDAARWSKETLLDGVDVAREWIQGDEFEPVRQRGARINPWAAAAGGSTKIEEERKEPAKKGWLAATFGGLSRITPDAITRTRREPGTWSSGEVHAELERDDDGIFQYKSLFVDIPSTQAAMRQRVWVVRKKGEVKR